MAASDEAAKGQSRVKTRMFLHREQTLESCRMALCAPDKSSSLAVFHNDIPDNIGKVSAQATGSYFEIPRRNRGRKTKKAMFCLAKVGFWWRMIFGGISLIVRIVLTLIQMLFYSAFLVFLVVEMLSRLVRILIDDAEGGVVAALIAICCCILTLYYLSDSTTEKEQIINTESAIAGTHSTTVIHREEVHANTHEDRHSDRSGPSIRTADKLPSTSCEHALSRLSNYPGDFLHKDVNVPAENLLTSYSSACGTQTETVQIRKREAPILCSQWQAFSDFSSVGGRLQKTNSDVILHVPQDAVERGSYVDVYSAVCANEERIRSLLAISDDEYLASPLAEFWAGENFRFQRPVLIQLPHVLPPHPAPHQVKVYRVSRRPDGHIAVTRVRQRNAKSTKWSKSNLPPDDAGIQWEPTSTFQLADDGKLYVSTDCFSGYVCTYCGRRNQGPPVLIVIASGSHQRKPNGQPTARVSLHVWDKRLEIADFQEECGIKPEDTILGKSKMKLSDHPDGSEHLLHMRLSVCGEDRKHWRRCQGEDDQPSNPDIQICYVKDILGCSNPNCKCNENSSPGMAHWRLEGTASCEQGYVLEGMVYVCQCPVGVMPTWTNGENHERTFSLPIEFQEKSNGRFGMKAGDGQFPISSGQRSQKAELISRHLDDFEQNRFGTDTMSLVLKMLRSVSVKNDELLETSSQFSDVNSGVTSLQSATEKLPLSVGGSVRNDNRRVATDKDSCRDIKSFTFRSRTPPF